MHWYIQKIENTYRNVNLSASLYIYICSHIPTKKVRRCGLRIVTMHRVEVRVWWSLFFLLVWLILNTKYGSSSSFLHRNGFSYSKFGNTGHDNQFVLLAGRDQLTPPRDAKAFVVVDTVVLLIWLNSKNKYDALIAAGIFNVLLGCVTCLWLLFAWASPKRST